MKKYVKDLTVRAVERLNERYVLLRLTDGERLPEMQPGQFAEVRVDDSPLTFLRRPISICYVDREANELWLLVACIGDGTRRLGRLSAGDRLNCMLPLGHGWTQTPVACERETPSACEHSTFNVHTPKASQRSHAAGVPRCLLVGGGVGVAPLLGQGAELRRRGCYVTFLLGARSAGDLLLLSEFERHGRVLLTTEDGSRGERGFVTQHSVLGRERFDMIQCCGPTPMMRAVARYARSAKTPCEVSLENLMACGLGACLCCVERAHPQPLPKGGGLDSGEPLTSYNNVCVCKEGPVFNIDRLLWQD